MDTTVVILIVGVAAVAMLFAAGFVMWRNKREETHLVDTFGDEYKREIANADKDAARAELRTREERVKNYDLRELTADERRAFAGRWDRTQAEFVDSPSGAVTSADDLLTEVMQARGYQTDGGSVEARIADVSVGHADEAAAFREAVQIAALNRSGNATTEDLRRAMKDYRVVFTSLLDERVTA